MGYGQRLARFIQRAVAPQRTPESQRTIARNYFDGAANTRRTQSWRAPTTSPNAIIGSLAILRDRSRAATRNDGYAKGVIDKLVANIVGTGIKPLSQAADPAFRKAVQALWLEWTDECDADGLLDWYGQQTQAVRAWLEGGEVFVRRRDRLLSDGLSVPLQLQVIEPELCPHNYSTLTANGGRIRAGVEFDPIGRRVAYWFHPSRPTSLEDYDRSQLVRVPADAVTHLYDPLRPGQIRGIPLLTPTLVKLYDLDKFDDATLLRQQLSNLFVGFITRPAASGDEVNINPVTGLPVEEDADGNPMAELNPGVMQELSPGEEVTFSQPPGTSDGYADFMKQQLRGVATSAGVPYEVLTGDLSGVSDRTLRVILIEFRRRIQALQHQIVVRRLCYPVWSWWFDRAYLARALRPGADYQADPGAWRATKWMPQGWPYLHPVQDVDADKAAIRAGFTSRSAVVSEAGEDAEAIDAEQAADNERADELGLRYDSDGRTAARGSKPADDSKEVDDPPPATTTKKTSKGKQQPIPVNVTDKE